MVHFINIDPAHWAQMEVDVDRKAPEEACGIVIGQENQSTTIIPVINILHSSNRFRMDPQEELDAFYTADKSGLDVIAIYHSHPRGLGEPSQTDREELSFPGIVYLIWYREGDSWNCRGFEMKSRFEVNEIQVVCQAGSKPRH